jgi:hypothetical protein
MRERKYCRMLAQWKEVREPTPQAESIESRNFSVGKMRSRKRERALLYRKLQILILWDWKVSAYSVSLVVVSN